MKTPTYQYFSLDEYRDRLAALRSRMEQANMDVLLVTGPENLYYLTGYQTPGYYWYQTLIVPLDREPVFVVRRNEDSNVGPLSWVEDSRPYEDYHDWIDHTCDVLTDLGHSRSRVGLAYDGFFLTVRDEKRLAATLPAATLVDASGVVEAGRVIKSAQEIEYIRLAADAAEAGLAAGIDACRVGGHRERRRGGDSSGADSRGKRIHRFANLHPHRRAGRADPRDLGAPRPGGR